MGKKMSKQIDDIALIGQILAYILGAIVIIQILRALFGGTWEIEDIILAIAIFNLTITFSIGGYLLTINNKISDLDKRLHGHIEWHKGKDSKK